MDAGLKPASSRRCQMPVRFVCGLALFLGLPVVGQPPYSQFPSPSNGRFGHNDPDATAPFGNEPALDDKRLRQLNLERQKDIVSNTAKLLQLAKELNEEISDGSPMTEVQMRKASEIGKLARTVKEKMSFTVGGSPGLKSPMNPRIQ